MEELPQIQGSSINRRDFLKLKSFLLLWYYFFQSFGINLLVEDSKTIDYSLLDKLQQLPFSSEVMSELNSRVNIQKKYSIDANGKLNPLDRFIKEITNFIVSKKDFNDFKLLNSIKDEQIDYNYMFISTARHNEKKSMQYLQQKLIAHKDDALLNNALEYAIKSKSFDTTLHLMQQKLKLDNKSQQYLLNVLRSDEYEQFHKKISGNNHMMLPNYSKKDILKKRKMCKKTFSFMEYNYSNGDLIYDYLNIIVHNSLVDLYTQCHIDEFTLRVLAKRVYVTTYATNYRVDFMKHFELTLHRNGFASWSEDLLEMCYLENKTTQKEIKYTIDTINRFLYNDELNIYEFINIEIM